MIRFPEGARRYPGRHEVVDAELVRDGETVPVVVKKIRRRAWESRSRNRARKSHDVAVGLIAISDSKTFAAMSNAVHELRAWLAPTHLTLDKNDFNPEGTLRPGRPTRRVERLVGELLQFVSH